MHQLAKEGAASLPETNGRTITADEDGSNKDKVSFGRTRTLTEKKKVFRLAPLKWRTEKINGMLLSKHITIKDLLFSTRNLVVMKDELAQFKDLFKMLLGIHKEYSGLLDDEAKMMIGSIISTVKFVPSRGRHPVD